MKFQKIVLILSVFLTSCSSKTINHTDQTSTLNDSPTVTNEQQFEMIVNESIDGDNSSVKTVFSEVFGMEKAKKEAKIYCEKLDKGSGGLEVVVNIHDEYKKKVDEKIITKEELDAIDGIYYTIFRTAQITYCPKHREKDQIPLHERMK